MERQEGSDDGAFVGELAAAWHRLERGMRTIESGRTLGADLVRELRTSRSIVESLIRNLTRQVPGPA